MWKRSINYYASYYNLNNVQLVSTCCVVYHFTVSRLWPISVYRAESVCRRHLLFHTYYRYSYKQSNLAVNNFQIKNISLQWTFPKHPKIKDLASHDSKAPWRGLQPDWPVQHSKVHTLGNACWPAESLRAYCSLTRNHYQSRKYPQCAFKWRFMGDTKSVTIECETATAFTDIHKLSNIMYFC